jgi:lysine N6-hydroxylase
MVICATGYQHDLPRSLRGLRQLLLSGGGEIRVQADFSLGWVGPSTNRVFVQNAARHRFGVADPNLSLLAWRSARIANSLLGFERYDTGPVQAALDWQPTDESDSSIAMLGRR